MAIKKHETIVACRLNPNELIAVTLSSKS